MKTAYIMLALTGLISWSAQASEQCVLGICLDMTKTQVNEIAASAGYTFRGDGTWVKGGYLSENTNVPARDCRALLTYIEPSTPNVLHVADNCLAGMKFNSPIGSSCISIGYGADQKVGQVILVEVDHDGPVVAKIIPNSCDGLVGHRWR